MQDDMGLASVCMNTQVIHTYEYTGAKKAIHTYTICMQMPEIFKCAVYIHTQYSWRSSEN
jgi:hypothetical protein